MDLIPVVSGSRSNDLVDHAGARGPGRVTVSEAEIWAGRWQTAKARTEGRAAGAVLWALREAWRRVVVQDWAGMPAPEAGLSADLAALSAALEGGATPRGILEAFGGVQRHPWLAQTRAEGRPCTSLRFLLRPSTYEELRGIGAQSRRLDLERAEDACDQSWVRLYAEAFERIGNAPRRPPDPEERRRWDRPGLAVVDRVAEVPGFGPVPHFDLATDKHGWRAVDRLAAADAVVALNMASGNVAAAALATVAVSEGVADLTPVIPVISRHTLNVRRELAERGQALQAAVARGEANAQAQGVDHVHA